MCILDFKKPLDGIVLEGDARAFLDAQKPGTAILKLRRAIGVDVCTVQHAESIVGRLVHIPEATLVAQSPDDRH